MSIPLRVGGSRFDGTTPAFRDGSEASGVLASAIFEAVDPSIRVAAPALATGTVDDATGANLPVAPVAKVVGSWTASLPAPESGAFVHRFPVTVPEGTDVLVVLLASNAVATSTVTFAEWYREGGNVQPLTTKVEGNENSIASVQIWDVEAPQDGPGWVTVGRTDNNGAAICVIALQGVGSAINRTPLLVQGAGSQISMPLATSPGDLVIDMVSSGYTELVNSGSGQRRLFSFRGSGVSSKIAEAITTNLSWSWQSSNWRVGAAVPYVANLAVNQVLTADAAVADGTAGDASLGGVAVIADVAVGAAFADDAVALMIEAEVGITATVIQGGREVARRLVRNTDLTGDWRTLSFPLTDAERMVLADVDKEPVTLSLSWESSGTVTSVEVDAVWLDVYPAVVNADVVLTAEAAVASSVAADCSTAGVGAIGAGVCGVLLSVNGASSVLVIGAANGGLEVGAAGSAVVLNVANAASSIAITAGGAGSTQGAASGAAGLLFVAAATGLVSIQGSGTGLLGLLAQGVVQPSASSSGSAGLVLRTSASGTSAVAGAGTAGLAFAVNASTGIAAFASANANVALSTTGAGSVAVVGGSSAAISLASSGTAIQSTFGAASTLLGVGSVSSGAVSQTATASAGLSFSVQASVGTAAFAFGSGSLSFNVASTAVAAVAGTGNSAISVRTTASGTSAIVGAGNPGLTFGTNGSGSSTVRGTGAGLVTIGALGSSTSTRNANASSQLGLSAQATGEVPRNGSGTGVIRVGVSGSANPVAQGTGTSPFGLSAAGTATAVSVTRTGSGSSLFSLGAISQATLGVFEALVPDATLTSGWVPVGAANLHQALAPGDSDYALATGVGDTAVVALTNPTMSITPTTVRIVIRARG